MNLKRGISVIEIIVASSIISLTVISISVAYGNFVALSVQNTAKVQAALLLDEGSEAIKTMRGERWSNIGGLTDGVTYYFTWATNKWQATTTPIAIDNLFYRSFVTSSVYRDTSTFNILPDASGTLDVGTKKIDITVAWNEKGATTTRASTMYVFNLYE